MEDIKAFIASEYLRTRQGTRDILREPTLDDLESRVADVAAPGSSYYAALVQKVQDLVRLGDVVKPNDPEISYAEIRSVRLEGEPPYSQAIVTVCDVSNDLQVTLAENAPSGSESPVGSDAGRVTAWLVDAPLVLTDRGWVQTTEQLDGEVWIGADECLA